MAKRLISITSFSDHIVGSYGVKATIKWAQSVVLIWRRTGLSSLISSIFPNRSGLAHLLLPGLHSSQPGSNFMYSLEASGIVLAPWNSLPSLKSILHLGAGKNASGSERVVGRLSPPWLHSSLWTASPRPA